MKRENLQRAQKIEQDLVKREKLLSLLGSNPTVGIGYTVSNMQIWDSATPNTDEPFQQEANEFVHSVAVRIGGEIRELLVEMDEL